MHLSESVCSFLAHASYRLLLDFKLDMPDGLTRFAARVLIKTEKTNMLCVGRPDMLRDGN